MIRMRLLVLTFAVMVAAALPAAAADALPTVPATRAPVAHNPAERLASLPIEYSVYDRATHCDRTPQPGTTRLVAWLQANAAGQSWGVYRCERWGKGSASLHAEGRAIDWRLDARDAAQRRAGQTLIRLLLAPDRSGSVQALARRMGVQELIWDCGYWRAGMSGFSKYSKCYSQSGAARKRVGPTAAHLDHIHIGLSRHGATARTSFWTNR